MTTTIARLRYHGAVWLSVGNCTGWERSATKMTVTTIGMDAVIRPTRRYCTTATTRSSPPSSRAMATRPEAPPATRARAPVSGVTSRCRPSSMPASRLITSVASTTPTTIGQCDPSAATESEATMVPM